jgi:hypothetical protein
MLAIAAGFVAALLTDAPGPGPTPLLELLSRPSADALIATGLFALTIVPVAALAVACVALARRGERARATTAAAALVLLVASLVAAAALGAGR